MPDSINVIAIDDLLIGFAAGVFCWFVVRYVIAGFYTVDQNERAVKTVFGRAQRLHDEVTTDDPVAQALTPEERERYRVGTRRLATAGAFRPSPRPRNREWDSHEGDLSPEEVASLPKRDPHTNWHTDPPAGPGDRE